MRGSLFPYFPYFGGPRWKGMEDQNRGNRDPLMVLALHPEKTLRGSLFPLAPKGEVPKPWEGPYFPISPILVVQDEKAWRTKIGEIGTLSWFWHFTQRKRWEGPYFPLPLRVKCQNHERVPISPILVAHVLTRWKDMDHQNRGNRGNRDPLMVLALHP